MRSRPLLTVLSTTVLAGVLGVSLVACADAPESEPSSAEETTSEASDAFPAEVTNCGRTTTVDAAPSSAVTLNQGATEVLLALGLEESMTGTAYLDEAIAPQWQAAYETVPVLSDGYPKQEEFLTAEPDFAYASYGSAFDPKDGVMGQDELEGLGISSYLSPYGCEDESERPAPSFEGAWGEVDDIAALFGVPERAEELIAEQQATLDELEADAPGEGLTALWYDSGNKAPFVGAGGGGPQVVLDAVGIENIFADLDGGWAEASWEEVVAADPDVIVLADASWDTAADKQKFLEKDPVLSKLTAVQEGSFATISFAESTPGVRMVDGAVSIGEQVDALDTP